MPDPMELRNIYLREVPYSIPYRGVYEGPNEGRWRKVLDKQRKNTGFSVLPTTETYNWEGSGFDCSVDEHLHVNVPSKEILAGMGLTHGREAGQLLNKKGDVIALDPSIAEAGPKSMLIKRKPFLQFLKRNGFEALWVVIGEKLLIGTIGGGSDFPGRLEIGGAFKMNANGRISGKTYTKTLPPSGRQ